MPANLTPDYLDAEKRYRAAKSPLERIAALEEMLAVMPKHKGTDHLRADLRTKIAKMTQSLDKKTATQRATMLIEKVGAAQVALAGLPNTGKSRLVSALTKASPNVAPYPFTTQSATPGMMPYENIQIQLVDTPPLSDQMEWWLPHLFRRADSLLVIIDLSTDPLPQMEDTVKYLESAKIFPSPENAAEVPSFLAKKKKVLIAGNKSDLDNGGNHFRSLEGAYGSRFPVFAVSALSGEGLEGLKERIFQALEIIRVYTKAPGNRPDQIDPVILEKGSTLEDAAASVHKDFARKLKYARLWGSGKHEGIMAGKDHVLQDGDIIELHI